MQKLRKNQLSHQYLLISLESRLVLQRFASSWVIIVASSGKHNHQILLVHNFVIIRPLLLIDAFTRSLYCNLSATKRVWGTAGGSHGLRDVVRSALSCVGFSQSQNIIDTSSNSVSLAVALNPYYEPFIIVYHWALNYFQTSFKLVSN